jgi:hypothetical protein
MYYNRQYFVRDLRSGRLVVEVGWRRCDGRATCGWSRLTALLLGDCWECACSSLRLTWWGVLFSEDRWSQRVDLAGSRWSLRRPAPVRLQPQVARCHRNQPLTSNMKEFRLKLRITQAVYLQSVSIKAHTIHNRALIVARAPQGTY